ARLAQQTRAYPFNSPSCYVSMGTPGNQRDLARSPRPAQKEQVWITSYAGSRQGPHLGGASVPSCRPAAAARYAEHRLIPRPVDCVLQLQVRGQDDRLALAYCAEELFRPRRMPTRWFRPRLDSSSRRILDWPDVVAQDEA